MVRRAAPLVTALLLGTLLAVPPAASVTPTLLTDGAVALDLDEDGRLDAVRLSFDNAFDERLLDLSDFTVQGYDILAYETPSTSILLLLLREQPGFDSDATPSVTYKVTGSGGDVGSGTAATLDRMGPVLVAALAVVDDEKIRARFSEPVVRPDAAALDGSELSYQGGSGGATAITIVEVDGDDLVLTLDERVTADDMALDALSTETSPGFTSLVDAAGNDALADEQSLDGPRIVAAEGDIGDNVVRVRFNVPLSTTPGSGAFNLDEDGSTGGEPRTVTSVAAGGSADELLVRLSGPVRAEDVRSLEPARLIAAPDAFEAQGIEGSETIDFQPAAAPLTDGVAPRVVAASTQDRNRNGLIDAILVTLSEPARATANQCIQVVLFEQGQKIVYPLDESGGVPRAVAGQPEQLLVRIQERTTQEADTGKVPQLRINLQVDPCETGVLPFEDLAEVPDGSGGVAGNPVLPVGLALVTETDGAAPVILDATSQDRDADGLPDAYAVRFSEPIQQSGFDAANWAVQGHEVTEGTWDSETTLILGFSENPEGGSGTLPIISYSGGPEDLRDVAGNPLGAFERGNFPYIDDSDPHILRVYGDVGQDRLRVEFSEPVEGVTEPENSGSPGRPLVESDFFYDDLNAAGSAGIVSVQHNAGESVAVLFLTAPLVEGDLSPDGTAGDAVRAIQGNIREANGDAAADRAPVSGEPVRLLRLDVDEPDAPGDLDEAGVDAEEGADRITLRFTAGSDDAGVPTSGAVAGYRVYVQEEPFSETGALDDETVAAVREGGEWSTTAFGDPDADIAPAGPATPGDPETLTVLGLCPGHTYHVAFEAVDDFGNPSTLVPVGGLGAGLKTLGDETPATVDPAALRLLSTTHRLDADGFAVESSDREGRVTWEGFVDPESCDLDFLWVIDDDPDRTIEGPDVTAATSIDEGAQGVPETVYRTVEPGARFDLTSIERPAQRTLHVAALSEGGLSQTVHYPLELVLPIDCVADNLLLGDVEAIHEGGLTTVTWGRYRETLPEDVTLDGYQVWMRPRGADHVLLRGTVGSDTDGFEERRFLDDLKLRKGDAYLVTAYFDHDLCRFEWDEEALDSELGPGGPNATFGANPATVVDAPPVVPTWAWVTLTVVAMLLVAGLVLFFALRRQHLDESWLEEPEDPVDHDNPFGPDPVHDLDAEEVGAADPFGGDVGGTGLGASPPGAPGAGPSMTVTCPACTHRFPVQGQRPLSIVCPNCSASGTLE